jgi:hypothetical protein
MTRKGFFLSAVLGGISIVFVLIKTYPFEVIPLPGDGLNATISTTLAFAGDYSILVSMPTVGNPVNLPNGVKIDCAFTMEGKAKGSRPQRVQVTQLDLRSEYGHANLQQYYSRELWHLQSGGNDMIVTGGKCPAASLRGASLTLEPAQNVGITERFLFYQFLFWGGCIAVIVGLLGLLRAGRNPLEVTSVSQGSRLSG